jgi:hypothetical protein
MISIAASSESPSSNFAARLIAHTSSLHPSQQYLRGLIFIPVCLNETAQSGLRQLASPSGMPFLAVSFIVYDGQVC